MKQGIPGLRRLGVAALAALTVSVGLVPFAGSASATPSFSSTRLAGANRYDTAKVIATNSFQTASTVLIARGDLYPDALAGSYLAGNKSSPILLTFTDKLADETKTALTSLGATAAIILGGTLAVNESVADELRARGVTVTRIGGNNRFATASQVAANPGAANVGTVDGLKSAIVASGENFPDALAGGPASYKGALPTLLTAKATLSAETSAALDSLAIKQVFLLGGIAAVEENVASAIRAKNITVTRLAGADRSETATKISSDLNYAKLSFTKAHINLARGDDFADALTGGPHGGKDAASIVLAQSPTTLGSATTTYVSSLAATLTSGHVFGGIVAITDATKAAFDAAAQQGFIAVVRGSTKPVPAGSPITGTITPASGVTISSISISGPCIATTSVTPAASGATSFSVNTLSTAAAGTCAITVTTGFTGPGGAGTETDSFDVTIVAGTTPPVPPTTPTVPAGTAQDYAVTPTAAATQNLATTRTFSVSNLGTTVVDIALFACANVAVDPTTGRAQFTATGTTPTITAARGTQIGASITVVNGIVQTAGQDQINSVTPQGGVATFTVTGPPANSTGGCTEPVVFSRADGNDTLSLASSTAGATNSATEAFGVGGETTFVPGAAPSGSATGTVTSVNKDANTFVITGTIVNSSTGVTTANANATFSYDSNDVFTSCTAVVGGVATGCTTPLSLAQFEAQLSRDDFIQTNYNADPTVPSTFNLVDAAPAAPGTITTTVTGANSVTVGFIDSASPFVSSYNVYRTAQVSAACPAFPSQQTTTSGTGAYALVGTVADRTSTTADGAPYQFADSGLTAGIVYCYNVLSVSDGDLSNNTGTVTATPAATPPPVVTTDPTIIGARTLTDTVGPSSVTTSDVHRFIFSVPVITITTPSYTLQDIDGTVGGISCSAGGTIAIQSECQLNQTTQTIAGVAYGPSRIFYVTLTPNNYAGGTTGIATGQIAGGNNILQYPATVIAISGIQGANTFDLTTSNGRNVDLPNSSDKVLGLAEPCNSSGITPTVPATSAC